VTSSFGSVSSPTPWWTRCELPTHLISFDANHLTDFLRLHSKTHDPVLHCRYVHRFLTSRPSHTQHTTSASISTTSTSHSLQFTPRILTSSELSGRTTMLTRSRSRHTLRHQLLRQRHDVLLVPLVSHPIPWSHTVKSPQLHPILMLTYLLHSRRIQERPPKSQFQGEET
jgi:hypothetical protein